MVLTDTRRLELRRPCQPGYDLLSCPDFQDQTGRYARMPRIHIIPAAEGSCPWCDREQYDMRVIRVVRIKSAGLRIGDIREGEGGGVLVEKRETKEKIEFW